MKVDALYRHPNILAAIGKIEAVCQSGEKVLVFGRFTKPMQALVRLLNARQMLRCYENDLLWPQSIVHQDEVSAVEFELRKRGKGETLDQINAWLERRYRELENKRERFRTRLRSILTERMDIPDDGDRGRAIALVARPIQEMMGAKDPTDEDIINAFSEIMSSASDQDSPDAADNDVNEGGVRKKVGCQSAESTQRRIFSFRRWVCPPDEREYRTTCAKTVATGF